MLGASRTIPTKRTLAREALGEYMFAVIAHPLKVWACRASAFSLHRKSRAPRVCFHRRANALRRTTLVSHDGLGPSLLFFFIGQTRRPWHPFHERWCRLRSLVRILATSAAPANTGILLWFILTNASAMKIEVPSQSNRGCYKSNNSGLDQSGGRQRKAARRWWFGGLMLSTGSNGLKTTKLDKACLNTACQQQRHLLQVNPPEERECPSVCCIPEQPMPSLRFFEDIGAESPIRTIVPCVTFDSAYF
jgi:hypothetical protein